MHNYSYDMRDPVYEIDGFKFSVQIVTVENVYGLNPAKTALIRENNGWKLECAELSWAGQQETAEGRLVLTASRNGNNQLEVELYAEAEHNIRCVKLIVRDLGELNIYEPDSGREVSVKNSEDKTAAEGKVYYYPYNAQKYMYNLKAPVFFVKDNRSRMLAFRCEDHKVRAKRFVVYAESFGRLKDTYSVELIHEESAYNFDSKIRVPKWVISEQADPAAFFDEYLKFAESEQGLGLVPWEKRTDFPAWLREISLVLTIHGMHWSGYVFNTYSQMLEIIRYVADRIDGRHVLVYLPGWEGRYYWQYGEYRPDPRLGGEEGFARLCSEAKKLGVHVMPMFGSNVANMWFPGFSRFDSNAFMKSADRIRYHAIGLDWDLSRAEDNGWMAFMNTGSPSWRKDLVRQIVDLANTYDFDSVFLDLVHHWTNDPDYDIFQGMRDLKKDINALRPDLLVVGENYYDGLLAVFPLFQVRPFLKQPKWVGRYARTVAHLLEAEPSRGSTGVHERGYHPYEVRPIAKEYLPTVAFVDGTLQHAREVIDSVIRQAHEYKQRFIDGAGDL